VRAIDLFCCAGGATRGLQQVGFEVHGVDIKKQRRYCGVFWQADALKFPLGGYDFLWASPPCQGYTALRHAPGTKGAAQLIGAVRKRLEATGKPYAIENVMDARWDMRDPIVLCGCMFGLGAQGCRLQRRRLFECSFPVEPPPCTCATDPRPVIGIYGGHARKRAAKAGGRGTKDVWEGGHKVAASEAMGIDWMSLGELSEAIPPAYSRFIAESWLQHG
jgi:DNA (cytosine-5)-methyltransferase 1